MSEVGQPLHVKNLTGFEGRDWEYINRENKDGVGVLYCLELKLPFPLGFPHDI